MEEEIEKLIEELTKVRPERLNEEALKLFNTIMAVLDERDKLKKERDEIYADYQDLGKEKLKLEEENEDLKNDLHHDGLAHKYLTLKATTIPKSKAKEKIEELSERNKARFNKS